MTKRKRQVTDAKPSDVDEFTRSVMRAVDYNFRLIVNQPDSDWPPLLFARQLGGDTTYMDLQNQFVEHGTDLTLSLWAPIQVQTHAWTQVALVTATSTGPVGDDDTRSGAAGSQQEIISLVVFRQGGDTQAFCARVRRSAGRPPTLGRWVQTPSRLDKAALTAMQSAVDQKLLPPDATGRDA